MFEVTIEETFAAGHALRNYRGKCENVHGHNYRCQVTLEGEQLDAIGLLVDFVELKRVVHAVLDRMDHQWLNEFPPFDVLNPSAENMAKYIYDEVKQGLGSAGGSARGRGASSGRRIRRAPPTANGRGRQVRRGGQTTQAIVCRTSGLRMLLAVVRGVLRGEVRPFLRQIVEGEDGRHGAHRDAGAAIDALYRDRCRAVPRRRRSGSSFFG